MYVIFFAEAENQYTSDDTYIHATATQLLILFFLSELAISDQDYSKPELHNGEMYFLNS